ncbi:fetuin-B isoform X1 [Diceros bicornis minor]|uniref:fetuin-B isoform X1 n=1 Tax=Diceros bicornis minor TaxID=77932 RepID=UPI0026E972DF|nr:fetuin-B isoform X1 [Diceros bicornis minor]
MGLLLPLALCALAACYRAASLPRQAHNPSPLLSRGCNDSDVLKFSDFALQDINKDRRKGFVLSLNRVNDVYQHKQSGHGSVFYLTLDVLETDCHVLSKKAWKDCGERTLHESVYGQCKAIYYTNLVERIFYTAAYNCTLRPVSRRAISNMCPDCPGPVDLSYSSVLEAALESLAQYNNKSTSKQYSLVRVIKASSQWVFGPAYFVQYLITESPCTKSQAESAASKCPLQLPDSDPVGHCEGSLSRNIKKFVSVSCKIFEPQDPTPRGENSAADQRSVNLPEVIEPQKKNTAPTNSPSKAVSKGSVQYLPELVDEKPKESQEAGPAFPVQLDLTTNPQGETLDLSFLIAWPVEKKLVVLPFPKKEQRSAECPGPAQVDNPLVLPP